MTKKEMKTSSAETIGQLFDDRSFFMSFKWRSKKHKDQICFGSYLL